jgi:hypothetical protein
MMKQEDPESPSEFAIRLLSAAHRLGPLVGPAELKALYEGGLTDNVRHMLRATLKPDPRRTIDGTVSAAAALAEAMGRPSPLRPTERTNRISALSRTAAHPALIVCERGDGGCDGEDPDVELEDGAVVCYGSVRQRSDGSRSSPEPTRLCWTCWFPGHFADDCSMIPDHYRAEIAKRKHIALKRRKERDRNPVFARCSGWKPREGAFITPPVVAKDAGPSQIQGNGVGWDSASQEPRL